MLKSKPAIMFLISMIIVACAASSCGKAASAPDVAEVNESSSNVESINETTIEDYKPNLPDKDFEDYEFKFLQVSCPQYAYKLEVDIFAEGQNGGTINDAVYSRNLEVEEKYNVNITAKYTKDFGEVSTLVRKAFTAGDDIYDAVSERLYNVPELITSGALIDLHLIPNIDFSRNWWDENSVKNLAIGGKLYIVASDIYLSDKYATSAVLFNKQMIEDHKIENIYSLVSNGSWTLDKIKEISTSVTQDLDGDGILNENDLYGMLGRRDMTTFFFHGAGGRFAELDENGMPVYVFYNDHNISAVQKVFDILYNEDIFYNVHKKSSLKDSNFYELFRDGHCLFYVGMLLDEVEKMRESELNFGIVPNPKFDEEQENYYSTVSVHHTGLLSVPAISGNLERTGIILEALSAKSRETLQPAYYETALKGKYLRDVESESMLDIIFGNRVFDVGDIMNFGNFSIKFICISTDSGSSDIASLYTSNQEAIDKGIEKFVKEIKKLP